MHRAANGLSEIRHGCAVSTAASVKYAAQSNNHRRKREEMLRQQ
jgi:hypothetical protein